MIDSMKFDLGEVERRNNALAAQGGEVIGQGQELSGREVRQMLSVRIESELIAGLRKVAESRGLKVSDLLRESAAKLVEDYQSRQVTIRTQSNLVSAQIIAQVSWTQGGSNASFSGEKSNLDYLSV